MIRCRSEIAGVNAGVWLRKIIIPQPAAIVVMTCDHEISPTPPVTVGAARVGSVPARASAGSWIGARNCVQFERFRLVNALNGLTTICFASVSHVAFAAVVMMASLHALLRNDIIARPPICAADRGFAGVTSCLA
jgi:hypothetical protein